MPFYIVEWKDHTRTARSGWAGVDEIDTGIIQVLTSGWKVKEDEDVIVLAQNVGNNGLIGETMTILKSCIINQTKL